MDACPPQKQLQGLGRADCLQLGTSLEPIPGMRAPAPVLPGVALRRAGSTTPLRFVGVGFVIATDA
jgi:hypothetical protein